MNNITLKPKDVINIDVRIQNDKFAYYFLMEDDSWVYPNRENTIDIYDEIPNDLRKIIANINIQKRFDL